MSENIAEIAARSITNCHVRGVDSVVLATKPMKRFFFARPEHELWKNSCLLTSLPTETKMSVGLHSHHCDVTLEPIFGIVWNILAVKAVGGMPLKAYRYHSQIREGRTEFQREKASDSNFIFHSYHLYGKFPMKAEEFHTIFVPQGASAAWFVSEGAENPLYDATTFTNADLESETFEGLYQPMTEVRCRETMQEVAENMYGGSKHHEANRRASK